MTDHAELAHRVHRADWYVKAGEGAFGRGETTVVLRGSTDKEWHEAMVDLKDYLREAGEISTRLLRPADGVVIGKMMRHLSDCGFFAAGDLIEESLVKAFTVYLRGDHA